jgi:TonB family protein
MATQSAPLDLHEHWLRTTLEREQPRRLLLALLLLLVALTVVVVKDREFWFGTDETIEAEGAIAEPTSAPAAVAASVPVSAPLAASAAQQVPAAAVKTQTVAPVASEKHGVVKHNAHAAVANAAQVPGTRAVLPPMAMEVIAADTHHGLQSGSNAVKIEVPRSEASRSAAPVSNAAELVRVTPAANQPEVYPMLAQRSRVEGSVVLQALIGTDGVIRNLRVLSGPSILTAAAEQAVRQWRFKPYLENGQAVETQAHITVSFTIKVSDNAKSS